MQHLQKSMEIYENKNPMLVLQSYIAFVSKIPVMSVENGRETIWMRVNTEWK